MAITNNADAGFIQNLLKVYYEDKVESLLFRDDPVLNNIKKERVEGKAQHFACLVGRGGAVAGDFTIANAEASKNTKSAEFQVVPGKIFSVYTMTSIEVQAAKTLRGAYMPIAAAKMFAATEAFRKHMAAALYGFGYGEIAYLTLPKDTAVTANASKIIVIEEDAAMKIDIGSKLLLKDKITTAEASASNTLEVTKVGSFGTYTVAGDILNAGTGVAVTCKFSDAITTLAADTTYVVALAGSMNGNDPLMPAGLSAWLPYIEARSATGSEYPAYIATSFMGVSRDVAVDRMAGAFYAAPSKAQTKAQTVENLLRKVRQQGGKADFIVMNDKDWMDIASTLQSTQVYWTSTVGADSKGKKTANVGMNDMRFNFSTSWIENVYDSPFCPQGVFYILDSRDFRFWGYYNDSKISNGVPGNEPGTADPNSESGDIQNKPYQLLIDDYITVDGGTDSIDGPTARVTINCAGSFVVKNPAHSGVGLFWNYPADSSAGSLCQPIGYKLFA